MSNITPFWNINLPPSQHTPNCPSYLQYALNNPKDRAILSTPDSAWHRATWPEVQQIIHDNRLDLFERLPSDLRRYREYCEKLTREWGSVMAFVLKERLGWEDAVAKGGMFEVEDDIKILLNDWPYGFDPRIVHLVIWTKFPLPALPITDAAPDGDLTPATRQAIDDFVERTFRRHCGADNVVWFKNWSALKSIHAVEHFHVLLFEPDGEFVRRITGGDVALAEKVKMGEGCG